MLTGYLEGQGISLDTASLITAAEGSKDLSVRWAATLILAERGAEGAKDLFFRLLSGGDDEMVREAAAYGLARQGEVLGLTTLEELLVTSSDPMGRISVAAKLAKLGNGAGYETLVDALTSAARDSAGEADEEGDAEDDSRQGEGEPPPAVSVQPEAIRLNAVNSLQPFFEPGLVDTRTSPQPLELLLIATEDPAAIVRSAALTQISGLTYTDVLSLEEVRPRVEAMAEHDPEASVRSQASGLLTGWGAGSEAVGADGEISGGATEGSQ